MHKFIIIALVLLMSLSTASSKGETVYLLPGQGGDERLFQNVSIKGYDTKVVILETPLKNESLPEYALRLTEQIDCSQPFSLVGVSFGGMIAVEMAKIIDPEKVIIISSAKTKDELPYRYKVVKHLRIYKLFNGKVLKKSANIVRPIFEPDSKEDHEIFSAMIDDKEPDYLERAVQCVMTWENTEYRADIIHLHGTNDRTIPFRNVKNAVTIEGGSHMMVLTEGERIGSIVNAYLALQE